jgi:ankyrin repeat protein
MSGSKISSREFLVAAQDGKLNILQQYLDENRDNPALINVTDEYGSTALTFAAANGQIVILRALLAIPGLDVNAQTQSGENALMLAAYHGHTAIVEFLLATPGIDADAANPHGNTALSWATNRGHYAIVNALLAMRESDIRRVA